MAVPLDPVVAAGGGPPKAVAPPVLPSVEDMLKQLCKEMCMREETMNDMISALEKKRFILFRGLPGTGKTFLADKLSKILLVKHFLAKKAECPRLEKAFFEWNDPQNLINDPKASAWKNYRPTVVFHASYSYSDFVIGYRPGGESGQFEEQDGAVLSAVQRLQDEKPYAKVIMLIDELNRANVAEVFGELLTELEKRGSTGGVALGSKRERNLVIQKNFMIPENLHFIAMMNDADRSVGLLDRALQERFYHFKFPLETQSEVNFWKQSKVDEGKKLKALEDMKSLEKIAPPKKATQLQW